MTAIPDESGRELGRVVRLLLLDDKEVRTGCA
jgi:hypothetical protein